MSTSRRLRFGLWYDFRNPRAWRQEPTQLYHAILAQVARAESLGWDDVWLSEHHFLEDGYTPSLLPLAAAMAVRTERIRIGTSVILLPLHDPVRVAEDAATVDVLSGGRFVLGVAGGYRREEFEGFGVPLSERASRMEEALPILRRLLAGERVSCEGQHYRYRDLAIFPRPVQESMPIWVGGFSPPAARRAARLGDGYIAIGPMAALVEICRQELVRAGRDTEGFEIAGGLPWLLVSREPERRWQEARDHFLYQINLYARWFHAAGMEVASTARTDEDLRRQGVLIVSPSQATEQIAAYARENGINRFYGWTVPPGLPPGWSDEHIELMATEVLPAFGGGPTNPTKGPPTAGQP